MERDRPSWTAEAVAASRAAHQLLDVPPLFVDPLAVRVAHPQALARRSRRGPRRYLRAFLVARSRFAEECVEAAVRRGVTQYVIVGAGYDTFAYRNPFPQLRVFELDHPATQKAKLRRLATAGIEIPPNVTHAAVDLAATPLADALDRAHFDRERPAIFAWLGVLPYLEVPAIESVFRTIAALPQAELVFDYGEPPDSLGFFTRLVMRRMAKRVAAIGEPWKTRFSPEELRALVLACGFGAVDDLDADAINARWFAGRRDGLRVARGGRLVRATTFRVSS